jgi:regulatory protein
LFRKTIKQSKRGSPAVIVTALERNARRRSRLDVFVDGIIACDISRATAAKRGLRIGSDLRDGGIEALVAEDRSREATETVAAMLARRPRSEREVRRRLEQRKLQPDIVEATVARFREARLLDDEAYARSFTEARDRVSPRGKRLLVQELRTAGVALETATQAVSDVSDAEAAFRVAAGRMRSLQGLDEAKFRARLGSLLQRRGFGWDVVRGTVEQCWFEAQARASGDEPISQD